jgi:hypothetical protein
MQHVVTLADFAVHYHLPDPRETDLQLFVIHTYYGIFCKGELRLYEGRCGEMVWKSEQREGHDVTLLAPPSSQHWIGLHDNSGVWVLRGHRLSEHTHLLSHALFPITTNADETTPGDYLEQGRAQAASLCSLWGLSLPATRCGLEALLGQFQRDREVVEDTDNDVFLPLLSSELTEVLRNAALQSPALLVALLAEHPRYRLLVSEILQTFLLYLGRHGDSVTPMTKEVASLLQQYHSLSQTYANELALWGTGVARQLLLSTRPTVTSLLHRLEGCHDNSSVCVWTQLQLLGCSDPSPTLLGVRDYLAVPSFATAVGRIEGGDWPSNVALECRFDCRMSFPIDWSPERARNFAEEQVRRAAGTDPWLVRNPPTIRYNGFRARGWVASPVTGPCSLVDLLEECHRGVTGKDLERDAFPGTADARYFKAELGEQSIYYGPRGGNLHAPDEYVELESVLEAARVLSRLVIRWCS